MIRFWLPWQPIKLAFQCTAILVATNSAMIFLQLTSSASQFRSWILWRTKSVKRLFQRTWRLKHMRHSCLTETENNGAFGLCWLVKAVVMYLFLKQTSGTSPVSHISLALTMIQIPEPEEYFSRTSSWHDTSVVLELSTPEHCWLC